jgi:hypothetical protein
MFELARQIARIAEATRRIDRTRCVSSLSKNVFRAAQGASGLGRRVSVSRLRTVLDHANWPRFQTFWFGLCEAGSHVQGTSSRCSNFGAAKAAR